MQFLKSPYITAPFYSFPLLCCTVQYMHLLQCGRSRMFIPFPGSDFLPSQITDRVGNGISFRKNSAEKTRNDFRYSAEESIHSEAFRVPRKSQFRSSERSGTEWNSAEKNSFTEQQQSNLTKWFVCTSKVVFSDTIIEIFGCRVLFCPGILEQSMGARNQVGIGLLYRPAGLNRLAESILGLLKSLKIRALAT
jgi:hypothetical protein